MKRLKYILVSVLAGVSLTGCFDLTEETFDRLDPSTFYSDESNIQSVIAPIYARMLLSYSEYFWYLNEFSADQIMWRTWNGGNWGWDDGDKFVISTHTWTSQATVIRRAWEKAWEAIGLCNNALSDFNGLSAGSVGIPQEKLDTYRAEVRTLRAFCYYNVFELWGGAIPLFTDGASSEIPGSVSNDFDEGCKIVFDFICDELDASWEALPQNSVNRMNQAMNRMLKMRMLLNAEPFIGEARYTECAKLAQEILNGDYGHYEIVADHRRIYDWDNDTCPEVVFAFASDVSHQNADWMRNMPFLPSTPTFETYFSATLNTSGWGCCGLTPSYDNSGELMRGETAVCFLDAPYNDKLGAIFERFQEGDVRKAIYTCDVNGNHTGSFLYGPMSADFGSGDALMGDSDYDGSQWWFTDQVGTFRQTGGSAPLADVMSPRWGESNSGIRSVKYPVYPDLFGHDFREADQVEFRLAEVVYTLAECKLRAGDANGAKDLVNSVRQRYFPTNWSTAKENPGRGFTAFDQDWMLSEWGIEFLDEGRRRRTDLRRFDKFTQGQWWFFGRATEDGIVLPAKRDRKYEWFPLPETALSVNPGLKQNPNYL